MAYKEDASFLLTSIENYMRDYLPGYQLFVPKSDGKKCVIYKNFPAKELSVVVYLPAITTDYGKILRSGKKAGMVLKVIKRKGYLFEFTDTLLSGYWKNILKEKIEVLEDLVAEVRHCVSCTRILVPQLCQTKQSKTWFVSTYCPVCREWKNTDYGKGLKTRLHKFLKARNTGRRKNDIVL